jgi:hypothetical protein
MADEEWIKRGVIGGLAAAALVAALPLATSGGQGEPSRQDRQARRQWALARMDEMAQERLRCYERFREPRAIRDCQAEFERRHRAYNEVYIEATRE